MKQEPYAQPLKDSRLVWVERIARLMDDQFRVPGTSFRFGLDPLMNLVPFLGDLSGFFVSAALVLAIARHGASSKIVVLMCINIVLDATIGAIPFVGQVFDFYYKANSRNIRLLKEHYQEGKHTGSGKNVLLLAILVLVILVVLIGYLAWKLVEMIAGWF